METGYILAFDQGTTSSRSILYDAEGRAVASAQREFPQIYPRAGWVEHDPEDIWQSQLATARYVLRDSGVAPQQIAGIGITNQRETTVVWDRRTGEPIHNAIVWQCRRTTEQCEALRAAGHADTIRARTGLVIDAYFSGTKAAWILDAVPGARARAARGELCFGTIDSWLLWRMTGQHATDYTNASRTMLFDLHRLDWDHELCDWIGVPPEMLLEAKPTSHLYGTTTQFGGEIPVAAMVGDQQGALFGQTAFDRCACKNTYGTGCFLLMNTGDAPVPSDKGLLTTIAWGLADGTVEYALEGSVFVGGAVVQWLRDEMHLIDTAADSEGVAARVPDSNGVYVVPAFTGLGAPHWDMRARGLICGLTRGAGRAHLVRAALESIAYQSADVVRTMEAEMGAAIPSLRVDGGAAANNLLMQHQADVLGVPVIRGQNLESTAQGAAYLAGLAVGMWGSRDELRKLRSGEQVFEPQWDKAKRDQALQGWAEAVGRARTDG